MHRVVSSENVSLAEAFPFAQQIFTSLSSSCTYPAPSPNLFQIVGGFTRTDLEGLVGEEEEMKFHCAAGSFWSTWMNTTHNSANCKCYLRGKAFRKICFL